MSDFQPEKETCPHCRSYGNCVFHKTYQRFLVDHYQGKIETHVIDITVVRCSSCGSYHSIMPDIIIPYLSHSLIFILTVLEHYFSHRDSVRGICDRFGIEPPVLYRWKKQFEKHKQLWLGALDALSWSSLEFLDTLIAKQTFSLFNDSFISKFIVSFLQSHKEHCRRHVFRRRHFMPG